MQDAKQRLWRLARKRAEFKKSVLTYVIVNVFLWAVWWVSSGKVNGFGSFPWPLWVMIGWTFVLAYQYFEAYGGQKQSHD
jgi:hypothetical protein